jgi:lactoylglutathione lyase
VGGPYGVASPDRPPPGFEIGLGVADVRAAFARATKAGAVAVKTPTEMPWGQTVAYVRDPDGHLIVLVEGD